MSAIEAQWIVIGFLNLACRITVVVVLAAGADLLLRRYGAASKALVWTMALAAVVLVIAVQLLGRPSTHPSIRFNVASASEGVRTLYRGSSPHSSASRGNLSAWQLTTYPVPTETPDAVSRSTAKNVHGFRPDDVPSGDAQGERNVRSAGSAPSSMDSGPFSPWEEGRSRRVFTASRTNRKPSVWQIAGWGVVFLVPVSALLLIRVVIGTLGLKNLILKWRGRTPPPIFFETLAELKKTLRIRRSVRLLTARGKNTPITFGIFRPTIVLPAGLTKHASPDSLRQMLAHELAHIRRYDSLVILLQRVCMALCFWHPLTHVAIRRLRTLIEDACDDYVLRVAKSPEEYATCLAHLAAQTSWGIAGISGWTGTKRKRLKLEKRIERILDRRRQIGRSTPGAVAITVAVAIAASLGASWLPFFGIAAEESGPEASRRPSESDALKLARDETPSQQAQRLLDGGEAPLAIRVLRQAIEQSADPSTSLSLRYELARVHQLLVDGEKLEETLPDIWGTLPQNVDEITKFADFCIASRQEKLAQQAIARLQGMVPEKSIYYASKLYGAFPSREELWFPFQPKAMEKTAIKLGTRNAVLYQEQLIPALARVSSIADLDGDGTPEVILSSRPGRWEGGWIRVFSPGGELLWKDEKPEGEWDEDIQTFDLEGDGRLEVIAAGAGIAAYDCRGKILCQHPMPQEEDGRRFKRVRIVRSPKGCYRIIAGVGNRMVCLSADGNVEWRKMGVLGDSFVTTDLNGDGWDEILTMKIGTSEMVAFDQKGEEILTTSTDLNLSTPRLAVEDLNGDGKPEIIGWGGGQNLLVCGMDGKAIWKTRSRKGPIYAVGDLDGDGKKEIACVTPTDELRILNADGSVRFELAVRTVAVQLADVDGDRKDEILTETHGGPGRYLYCVGRGGELRWRFPLPWGYALGFYAMPAAGPGKKGIVAVASHPFIILSADGKVLSITPMNLFPNALAADVNGDGTKEVIAGAPLLRVYDLPGNRAVWGGMATQNGVVDSGATAIDVDGDGAEELVFPCRGHVCVVNGKGELLHARFVGEFGEPVFGRIDVEGDGKNEILLCGNRRFLVLNGEGEVIAAATHRGFEVHRSSYIAPHKVILAADVDSTPGEEILTCVDASGVTAYSPNGEVVMRFHRPSWLPVHPEYDRLFCFWRPQIFPPADINGDGKKELVARIDRLFVWDLQGRLLQIGLNDYPSLEQVSVARLKKKLEGVVRYVRELGASGSIAEYIEKAEKKPLMELYTSALRIRTGRKAQFVICGEKGMKLMRADGKALWRIPAERPRDRVRDSRNREEMLAEYEDVIGARTRCIGFADFDGDGRKEIVAQSETLLRDGRQLKRLEAFSIKGEQLWRGEPEDFSHVSEYVHGDFDGDRFMEITLEYEPGIAVVDLTPQ